MAVTTKPTTKKHPKTSTSGNSAVSSKSPTGGTVHAEKGARVSSTGWTRVDIATTTTQTPTFGKR
jgi:hypothetical protein